MALKGDGEEGGDEEQRDDGMLLKGNGEEGGNEEQDWCTIVCH